MELAPRDTGSLMPRNAVYAPPNVLPTLAEVDGMIVRITVPRARVAAVLMRGTGLRIEQVASAETTSTSRLRPCWCQRAAQLTPVDVGEWLELRREILGVVFVVDRIHS